MIFDKIDNLPLYEGVNARFAEIADFIEKNNMKLILPGKYELGSGVSANVSEYEPGDGGLAEAHRDFADLQYMVSGSEIIEVSPLSDATDSTGYQPDIEFFKGCKTKPSPLTLSEGTFAYFAPQDVHRPCIRLKSGCVRKIIFKIPVNK